MKIMPALQKLVAFSIVLLGQVSFAGSKSTCSEELATMQLPALKSVVSDSSSTLSASQKNQLNFRELKDALASQFINCLLYTSPSPRDATLSRMPSSA